VEHQDPKNWRGTRKEGSDSVPDKQARGKGQIQKGRGRLGVKVKFGRGGGRLGVRGGGRLGVKVKGGGRLGVKVKFGWGRGRGRGRGGGGEGGGVGGKGGGVGARSNS
jgi:hypothetical protein